MNDFLKTKIFDNNNEFVAKRTAMIAEAIALPFGTQAEKIWSEINKFSTDKCAYFAKPGKEAARKKPNKFDMLPSVKKDGIDITERWAFQQMWEYLIKVSIIQQNAFKEILVLLYRLCYMLDYKDFRYSPTSEILEHINNLEKFVLIPGFKEKFGTAPDIDLLSFLHFIDLLGWNEDVKYNTDTNGSPDFPKSANGKYKTKNTGRVNTILSIISASLLIGSFIQNIIENTENKNGVINVHLITDTIQRFTKSRGLCILSQKELLDYLEPYLYK